MSTTIPQNMSRLPQRAEFLSQEFPRIHISATVDDESRYCIICSEDFSTGSDQGPASQQTADYPVQIPCRGKHIFGNDCIRVWFNGEQTCPVCREVLFEAQNSHPRNSFDEIIRLANPNSGHQRRQNDRMDLRDSVDEMIQEARWIDAHRSQLNNTQPENYNLFSELIMTGFTDARLLRQNSINSGPVPIFALEYALSSGRRYLGRTSRYIPPSLRGVERMLRYYREYHTIRHSSLDQHKDRRSRIEALFTDRARDIDIRIGQIDHIRDEYRLGRIRYAEFKAAHVERGILREELRCIDRLKRRSIGSFVRSAINLVSNILPSSLNSAAS